MAGRACVLRLPITGADRLSAGLGLCRLALCAFCQLPLQPQQGIQYLKEVASGRGALCGAQPDQQPGDLHPAGTELGGRGRGHPHAGAEEQQGLAAGWFSFAQGDLFKEVHGSPATLMLLVVGGHIVGVVVESVLHKENLARSMVTGLKGMRRPTPQSRAKTGVAIVVLLAMLGFSGWWPAWLASSTTPPAQQQAHQAGEHHARHVRFVGPRAGRQRAVARGIRQLPRGVSPVIAARAFLAKDD